MNPDLVRLLLQEFINDIDAEMQRLDRSGQFVDKCKCVGLMEARKLVSARMQSVLPVLPFKLNESVIRLLNPQHDSEKVDCFPMSIEGDELRMCIQDGRSGWFEVWSLHQTVCRIQSGLYKVDQLP